MSPSHLGLLTHQKVKPLHGIFYSSNGGVLESSADSTVDTVTQEEDKFAAFSFQPKGAIQKIMAGPVVLLKNPKAEDETSGFVVGDGVVSTIPGHQSQV